MLTPERSMEVQRLLGSDIVMAFDQLRRRRPRPASEAAAAMERSMRWAKRSRDAFDRGGEHAGARRCSASSRAALDEALRKASADALIDDRLRRLCGRRARGRRGAGGDVRLLDFAPGQLPADTPRYLMGVGKPDDIVGAVRRGIDMFDCVLPTRSGRTGQAFTADGPINIRNARFAEDQEPLDPAARARPARRSSAPMSTISSGRARSSARC